MRYYIRQTNDVELIKKLHKLTFPSDEYYDHKGNVFWILRDSEKRELGFCIATDIGDKIIFLSRAGLLPEARGKGLHQRMIRTRINWARNSDYSSMITYVDIDNVASSRNLIRAGLELFRPEYDWVGKNYNYFRLIL